MTEIAEAEAAGASDVLEGREYASDALASGSMGASRRAAAIRQTDYGQAVRAELQFVLSMRQLGQEYLASQPAIGPRALLWRLLASVAIGVSFFSCGLLLTVVAFLDVPMHPNPYVALALLLVGLTLCATVATAVHGQLPRLRKR